MWLYRAAWHHPRYDQHALKAHLGMVCPEATETPASKNRGKSPVEQAVITVFRQNQLKITSEL